MAKTKPLYVLSDDKGMLAHLEKSYARQRAKELRKLRVFETVRTKKAKVGGWNVMGR